MAALKQLSEQFLDMAVLDTDGIFNIDDIAAFTDVLGT